MKTNKTLNSDVVIAKCFRNVSHSCTALCLPVGSGQTLQHSVASLRLVWSHNSLTTGDRGQRTWFWFSGYHFLVVLVVKVKRGLNGSELVQDLVVSGHVCG